MSPCPFPEKRAGHLSLLVSIYTTNRIIACSNRANLAALSLAFRGHEAGLIHTYIVMSNYFLWFVSGRIWSQMYSLVLIFYDLCWNLMLNNLSKKILINLVFSKVPEKLHVCSFFVCQCDDFLLCFDDRPSSFKVTLSVVCRMLYSHGKWTSDPNSSFN